jgi:hypothetical protein
MPSFSDEIDSAFQAFAAVAGTTITFKGVTLNSAVVHTPSVMQSKVDLELGRPQLVRVEVRRAEVADKCDPAPKVGDTFADANRVNYTIADIDRADITDPIITYVCKTTGLPQPLPPTP